MLYEPLIIDQIPYLVTSQRSHYPRHWHSEMELHICTQGCVWLELEDRKYTLKAGEAILFPGYSAHAILDSTPDFYRITVTFGYALLGQAYHTIQNTFLHTAIHGAETPERMRQAFSLIIDGFQGDGKVSNDWQIRSGLFLLASQLTGRCADTKPAKELQSRAQQLESIYAVLDYVSKHYAEKLSVDEAAEIAGYAKTYFCRQFKLTTGVSFHRYLNNYRISTACILLADPGLSISEVAARTGFSSAKLFCRTFKEITGMTTGQYQKLPPEERELHWPH